MEDDIDARNNETFGDVQTKWEIDDHEEIAHNFREQSGFPPHGGGSLNVYQDINELSERVAACILDDEDDGAKNERHSWGEPKKEKVEQRQSQPTYDKEAGAQNPVKVLTVQEVEQQLRNARDHGAAARPSHPNNELDPRPTPMMEQYYRQGAIPRHPQPGILYVNPSNLVNTNQAPPQMLQNQGAMRGTINRPAYKRFPRPRHPTPHHGNPRFPPHPGQHYPPDFPHGRFERPPFMPFGMPREQGPFMRPMNPGHQYPRHQGPPRLGNMGQGRGRPNFPYQRHPPPPVYVQLPNTNKLVLMPVHPQYPADRRLRHQGYDNEYNNRWNNDEYANLMTQQEKVFLKNIQLNALNVQNPYQDDYYYTMWCQRKNDRGRNNSQVGYNREGQNINRELQLQSTRTPLYTPQQFENSLGKLQIGSVSAPRKIIDTDMVDHETISPSEENARGLPGRDKQCLLAIEKAYTWLFYIQGGPSSTMSPAAFQAMKLSLIQLVSTTVKTFLSVNKGRDLIGRVMNLIDEPEDLTVAVLRLMPYIYRKGLQDMYVLDFLVPFKRLLSKSPVDFILEIADKIMTSILIVWDKPPLVSVIAMMVERYSNIYEEGLSEMSEQQQTQWNRFLMYLVELLPSDAKGFVLPPYGADTVLLETYLSRLFKDNTAQ